MSITNKLCRTLVTFGTSAFLVGSAIPALAGDNARPAQASATKAGESKWTPAVEPKALSKEVNKGLSWLLEHQLKNGAWGQGEEAATMGRDMDQMADKGNVADTCMATLSLIRSGSTPSSGPYAKNIERALDFVIGQIEKADKDSLAVTDIKGTRVQGKIGAFVDTFMSSQLLAETKGKMASKALEERHAAALTKVLHKIEKNQRQDGSFEGQAWAPVLSQAMASKGINRAAQAGAPVEATTLERSENYAHKSYDTTTKTFSGEGSAGVSLYSSAASAGAMSDSGNTRAIEEQVLRDDVKNAKNEKDRKAATDRLQKHDAARTVREDAQSTLVKQLADPAFISGFGSNGGEEFLSYMLVSESLVTKGGKEWSEWDRSMIVNLNRVQNPDGSWSGHHCITGRTFVTSAALLVLTADRAPVPLAAQIKKG